MSIRSRLRIRTRLRSVAYRIWPPKPKPLILMYHRIADEPVDPWQLAVSSQHFEEHLQVLRRTRYPLPLAQFVRELTAGTLRSDAVAITFDDGYVDNLDAGKPLLDAADVPATVFLATGYLNRTGEIWSDELARLVFLGSAPQVLELRVGKRTMHVSMGSSSVTVKGEAISAKPSKRRREALKEIWGVLRHLEDEERRPVMAELRLKLKPKHYPAKSGRAMTTDEVLNLIKDGLVDIGAHTVTHPVLPALGASDCHREISESKLACEALAGASVHSFAYPYGNFDDKSRAAVEAAGLAYACSTRHGPASAASDIFALPRIHVLNTGGDAFEFALRSASAA